MINGDDYFNTDQGYADHASQYARGDLDYSGSVDADDYWLIDANYSKAQTALVLPASKVRSATVLARAPEFVCPFDELEQERLLRISLLN